MWLKLPLRSQSNGVKRVPHVTVPPISIGGTSLAYSLTGKTLNNCLFCAFTTRTWGWVGPGAYDAVVLAAVHAHPPGVPTDWDFPALCLLIYPNCFFD